MPGILGFYGISDQQSAKQLMTAMVRSLSVGRQYEVDEFINDDVGLARVHLNIIDKQPQPAWSADGTVALVMAGEIYSWEGLALERPLTGKEPDFCNAELMLAAYLQHGETFPQQLNGTFAAAIWDGAKQRLLLVNDPFGAYPLYYAQVGSTFVFGSGARAVAEAPGLPRALNTAAMADLMVFEHLFGDKTLFAGVQLLLPGTILCFSQGAVSQRTYIDFQYPEYYELRPVEHYIEEWIHYTRQAVARQSRGPTPLGVLLTGGLDSRTILGFLMEQGLAVRTMTFGIPGCDDERAARDMAKVLALPHTFYPLPPDYLVELGAQAIAETDGQKSVVHLNMIGTLAALTQEAQVLYKGFLGGTIHGYVVSRERLAPAHEDVWFEYVFSERSRVFTERDLPQLYTPDVYRGVYDVPRQSLRDALARSHSAWWVDKDSYVDMYQEDARFTVLGVELARSRAHVRTPLADKDLLRFAMSVPPGFRADRFYYRQGILEAFPELAKVPYSGTRRPLDDTCFRSLRMRLGDKARWWLRSQGLRWVPVSSAQPYTDYSNWMRAELRPWIESVLLSPQALGRGIVQEAYVRNLLAEHMAGRDHTRQIGVLVSLELWHQQFID